MIQTSLQNEVIAFILLPLRHGSVLTNTILITTSERLQSCFKINWVSNFKCFVSAVNVTAKQVDYRGSYCPEARSQTRTL